MTNAQLAHLVSRWFLDVFFGCSLAVLWLFFGCSLAVLWLFLAVLSCSFVTTYLFLEHLQGYDCFLAPPPSG